MAEYVSREKMMALFNKYLPRMATSVIDYRTELEKLPTEDVVPVRHGHWIAKEDYNMDIYYECSVCKEPWTTIEGDPWDNGMNYCPHCGTRMDG